MPWHTSAQRSGRAERLSTVDVTMDMSGEPDDIALRTSTLRRSQGCADAALSVSELFRDHHLELVRLSVHPPICGFPPVRAEASATGRREAAG
jgi:hypothetical protein